MANTHFLHLWPWTWGQGHILPSTIYIMWPMHLQSLKLLFCPAWSGSKPFQHSDSVPERFFLKVSRQLKIMKNYPACKELNASMLATKKKKLTLLSSSELLLSGLFISFSCKQASTNVLSPLVTAQSELSVFASLPNTSLVSSPILMTSLLLWLRSGNPLLIDLADFLSGVLLVETTDWKNIWAVTCDFQQCGILTNVDSVEPVQLPFKLRNCK